MPTYRVVERMISNKIEVSVKNLQLNPKYELPSNVIEEINSLPLEIIENSMDLDTLINNINGFCIDNKENDLLVVIDHALLIETCKVYKTEDEVMTALPKKLNELKKMYPNLTVIVIAQLNDAFLSDQRMGKTDSIYPTYKDIYRGRQLYHISDTVMILNKPATYGDINSKYGLYSKVYQGKLVIFNHIIKGRDTGADIICYLDQLEHSKFIEVDKNVLTDKKKLI